MEKYAVTMGDISGEYDAENEDQALDLFAQDAGYKDWQDACSQGLASDDAVRVALIT
jgi:hypothetical protein